ncbi:MAG: AtzE family amidohydrolase [Hyphomonadaceae bacterium]
MSGLAGLGAAEAAALVRARKASAVDIAQAALARIAARDGDLNCCTAVLEAQALAAAAAIDARIARGEDVGPLAGAPFVAKNLFDVAGVTTLAGARQRRDAPPAAHDAAAVAKLRAAGGVLIALTNMDEYAYGFVTENEFFGPTRNPRDPSRLAGGSSGGAAAAVAAGMAPLSIGSDTNGSIRVPASFCGVFGLKPTFGRLSRTGAFPFVASLDHVGPMARSVGDLALAYDAMQGYDASDPVCVDRAIEPVSNALAPQKLRIGVLDGWFRASAEAGVNEAVDAAAETLGAKARVTIEDAAIARAAAFAITAAEGANLHLENLRRQPHAYDVATRDRFLAGALLPAALVLQAQRFRRGYQARVNALFAEYDILLAPAAPCPALPVGQRMITVGGVEVLARANVGIYTQPLSFIGLPIVVAPIVRPGALPIGVQIVAAPWNERAAFQAAAILERAGLAAAPVAP